MPLAAGGATEGLILSAALLTIAAAFAVGQWRDRRRRAPGLSEADADHFARQDVRRWIGSAVMALIAVGVVAGTRMNYRANRAASRLFLWTWLTIGILVVVLLTLALLDWLATRAYAHRHRNVLANERFAAIEEERRRLATRKNGRGQTRGPFDDPQTRPKS